ncbi:prefoldin subunit beta [Candidatus Bathyarchaeota archaeon]|nr:prefoldin subunit beta [Candidatus Bathyarchaeota archaeon]MBL7167789.1 prefoldin subunit beta [Candidatus Bathyarchaeota archaeon]
MSNLSQLPPDIQEKLSRMQQLQNMLQQLVAQKQRLELELTESDRALKTLEDTPSDAKVYKSAGAVLVEKDKDIVVKELTERKEFLDMRSKVLVKQETNTRERLTQLQENLQKDINQQMGSSP